MKNLRMVLVFFISSIMLIGCSGGRYVVKTTTTEKFKDGSIVDKQEVKEEIPVTEPVVVATARTYYDAGYSYPVYYGGYYYGAGYYDYPHKEKVTTKSSEDNRYWNYSSSDGRFNIGGSNSSGKSTIKWRRK